MSRFIIALLVVAALIGCSKSTTAPVAPETDIAISDGFEWNQPIYDVSDGVLYFSLSPRFLYPANVQADSMWVNVRTYTDVQVDYVVLPARTATFSWVFPAGVADSLKATICYKYLDTDWHESTIENTLPIVAQP